MVFPSIQAYLDPSNWQQQPNHQTGVSSANQQFQSAPPHPAPPPPPPQPHGGGGTATIRPNSMAERARIANMQMPEGPFKCPRCESSNTKFCYYNNYNLSQPRHFCKSCRRYWTRGGALRNVPVGGGCRRNKRSKSTSSKSPVSSSDRQTTSSSTSTVSSKTETAARMLGLTSQLPPLRFMSPLGQLTDHYNSSGDLSLNYTGISGISGPLMGTSEMNFQIGSGCLLGGRLGGGVGGSGGGGVTSFLSSGGGGGSIEQWRQPQQSQQLPFMSGLDTSSPGLYQFQGGIDQSIGFLGETSHQVRPKLSTSMLTQLASMKVEENHQELNLSRQLMGITGNDQWSNNAAWTDLSSFSSSSTSNPL